MARESDLVSIGDVLGAADFWKPNTLEEEVAKFKGRNDLYKDAEGILRCKKCHEPRVFFLAEAKRWLPCACKCCGKESKDDFQERVAQLKAESGIEGRNAKADFDDCEITVENEEVFNSCLRFAMNWKQVKKNGMGMYLYGDKDTGKTFLACCIANMLLDAGVRVIFATADSLLTELSEDYQKKADKTLMYDKFCAADLLIVDGLGSRQLDGKAYGAQGYAQDRLQQLIDERHTLEMSTIFTSQYTLQDLVNRGFRSSTVDRISEMSTRKFQVRGEHHRQRKVGEIPF